MTNPTLETIFARTTPLESCLIWTGALVKGRYGTLRCGRKSWLVHRLVYTLRFGEIPEGMYVCHKCDVPACCNPDHLFLGTQDDNMKDMVRKGRSGSTAGRSYAGTHWAQKNPMRGSNNSMAKLDEPAVKSIRALAALSDMQYKDIAAMYNLHEETVGCIVRKKAWAHVPDIGE